MAAFSLQGMALEEANRALDAQRAGLDVLRTRSGTILTGGSLVFSLFTGQALGKHHLDVWIWLALGSFVILAAATIAVIWPQNFTFRCDVIGLINEIDQSKGVGKSQDLSGAQRDWAHWGAMNYVSNQERFDLLVKVFTVSLVALSAEVIFLGLALMIC
jgi:hypothetical protein